MCDMTHSYVWHDSFICETWLIHMCDMTHSQHSTWLRVTWLLHMWDMTHSYVWHDSFICETWLIHILDAMIQSSLTLVLDSTWLRATWLIHMCDVTHSYERHDSFTCEMWLILTNHLQNSRSGHSRVLYAWHASFTYDTTYSYVTWPIHMWHDSFICETWLILIWITCKTAAADMAHSI